MATDNGDSELPKKAETPAPRIMAAEILADWQNGLVIIKERSQQGLALINPTAFAIPMDAFLMTAFNLAIQQLQKKSEVARAVMSQLEEQRQRKPRA